MRRRSFGSRSDRTLERLTWRRIAVQFGLIAAVPALLWAATQPLAAGVGLAASVLAFVGLRGGHRLVQCFYDCGGFAVTIADRAQITVTRTQCCNSR